MTTALVYDPLFLSHDTGNHPETSRRLEVIISALRADARLWGRLDHVKPVLAADADIERCHDPRMLERVRALCDRGERFIDPDTAISPESYEVSRLAAGAAVASVDYVFADGPKNAFALVRPPGHHATYDRAMGFCLLNNAAIGARYSQSRYGVERALIIDWDVHHGNGTQAIFYDDPTVFYFSAHQYPYYPGTGAANETGISKGEGYTLNVPLSAGTPARAHLSAFAEALDSIEKRFRPDLVLISAGFDSRRGDPLGGLLLEDGDFREMTLRVMDLAERSAAGRVISVLEGGYNLDALGETVRVHLAALAGAAGQSW